MKILHTADWHLGKRLDDFSRMEEQKDVLQEIVALADTHHVDAVVIAGDLFDNFNPSSEATELLYKTLHRLGNHGQRPVIAIAGNHDSPERINVPDTLARMAGIFFIGYPAAVITPEKLDSGLEVTQSAPGFMELRSPNWSFPLRIFHTAYANEQRIKTYLGQENVEEALRDYLASHWNELAHKYADANGFNLLVTHLFFTKQGQELEQEPDDERPILHVGGAQAIYSHNIPEGIHYVALGHLHRNHSVDTKPCPIVYAGSPLAYSFAEDNQQKYVQLLTVEAGNLVEMQKLPLTSGKKLLRVRFESIPEALSWLSENTDCLVELTIVSDTFLATEDKKALVAAHPGIIQIIPMIQNKTENNTQARIDLSLRMDELFVQYFKSKNNDQAPSESLMDLFAEVLGQENTSTSS